MAQGSPKVALTERVYGAVKESLLDGAYKPGDAVVVEKISADLRVSRQPVMDALKRLSMEGFVTIVPQVGCYVRIYSPDEMQDFFKLVAAGEALVAELAARRATAENLLSLKIISGQIATIAKTRKSAKEKAGLYRALNRRLHLEIARAARSPSIAELVATLGDRTEFFIASAMRPIFFERLQQAHKEHEDIIAAIEAGDGDRASRVMRTHILGIARRLEAPAPSGRAKPLGVAA
jgi:DNA-binding GntR family transcriptional regulator